MMSVSYTITPTVLRNLYEAKVKKQTQMLTHEELDMFNYFQLSENTEYIGSSNGTNIKYIELDRIFSEHCKQPCCLDKGVGMCLLHRSYAIYCFFRHLVQDTDYTNCRFCSILKLEDKHNIKRRFSSTDFQKDPLSNYINHFYQCDGCWKCKQSNGALGMIHRSSSTYSSLDIGGSNESDFIPVPNGIFYTQESDQTNHSGYLRIIPLSYENDLNSCEDYHELVQLMNNDRKYREERDFAYKQIENEEKEYRSVLSEDQSLFDRCREKYGVTFDTGCVEELSLSIKKYLFYILCCSQEERQLLGDRDSGVIDERVLLRVLKRHRYCVTPTFSFGE